jgi:hypothetical protein
MKLDWKSIVGTVAPALATALGGPLAGVAVKAIASGLNAKEGATEPDVAQIVAGGDPQMLVRLREIDRQFEKDMAALGIDLEQIAAEDRANARAREVSLGGDWTVRILAYTIIGSFCALVFSVLFGQITAESTIAGAVIGYLSAKAEQVTAYYFGSSAGSKAKTELMARR